VFTVTSMHLLYITRTSCPSTYVHPCGARAALIVMAVFYVFFVMLSIGSVWRSRGKAPCY
jgi:hypothetical protein